MWRSSLRGHAMSFLMELEKFLLSLLNLLLGIVTSKEFLFRLDVDGTKE